eukprot:INCI15747.2.p1 GENE.INCI15747.2~~INCI15747.2.p1  ORF type:complete len:728 (-),score=101.28 INCI15747.2:513-2696(-)
MTNALRRSWKLAQQKAAKEEAERNLVVVDPRTVPQHLSASRLVEAAIRNDAQTVRLLLDKGQEVNSLHPVLGYSALHGAVDQGHMGMVQLLVEAGADVNIPRVLDKRKNFARKSSNVGGGGSRGGTQRRPVGVLVEKPETSLDTPLHFAALAGRADIAEYLLKKCEALRDPINSANKTPLDYARQMQKWDAEVMFYDPPTPPGNLTVDSTQWLSEKCITFTFFKSIADPQDRVPVLEYEFVWRMREPCDDERAAPHIREAKDWQVIQVPAEDAIYQQYFSVQLVWNDDGTGLLPAQTYLLRTRGRNLIGWSPWTSTLIYTSPIAPPEAPDPAPFSITTTPSTVALRWYEPVLNGAPVLQYEIQMKRGPTSRACHSQEWKSYKLVLETDLKLFKLTAGDCHIFRVRARNRAGWGDYSVESEEIWTYKAITIVSCTPRSVTMSWGKARTDKLIFRFQVEVARLRDVPGLFYSLKDEIDPITIPQKYWISLSDSINCEVFVAEGHVPPPGTSSAGFHPGDEARPVLQPNEDYLFRCRSFHPDFGWAEWSDGIASEIVALPKTFPDRMAPPIVLHIDYNKVVVGWQEPLENGAYIDSYQLEMQIQPEEEQPDRRGFDLESPDMQHAPPDYQLPDRTDAPVDALPRQNWQVVDDDISHRARHYEVLGLDFLTDYKFRVSAHNRVGWGDVGVQSAVVRTAAIAPPGVPYQSSTADAEPLPVFRFHQVWIFIVF